MIKVNEIMIQDIPTLEVIKEENQNSSLPLVIFYHGWRSNKELVLTQARKLAQKNIRVVLPDAMNHGARNTDVSSIPSFTFWNSIQGNLAEFSLLKNYYAEKKFDQG
jgi:Hydrolases of the alpha/beta superfamily